MCDPIALGVMGIAGSIVQGIGAAGQRETNAQTLELNAKGIDRDIAVEKEQSAFEIARTREDVQRTQGSARAGYSANGLALSGSAAEVLRETAIEGELDIATIRWNSGEKVKGLTYQRDVMLHNARQERAAAPLAFISPVLGGVARFGSNFAPT